MKHQHPHTNFFNVAQLSLLFGLTATLTFAQSGDISGLDRPVLGQW